MIRHVCRHPGSTRLAILAGVSRSLFPLQGFSNMILVILTLHQSPTWRPECCLMSGLTSTYQSSLVDSHPCYQSFSGKSFYPYGYKDTQASLPHQDRATGKGILSSCFYSPIFQTLFPSYSCGKHLLLFFILLRPRSLNLPGSDLENIMLLRSPDDANKIGMENKKFDMFSE